MIQLANECIRAAISPQAGGSVMRLQVYDGESWRDISRWSEDDDVMNASITPICPWFARTGPMEFEGQTLAFEDHPSKDKIHGLTRYRAFDRVDHSIGHICSMVQQVPDWFSPLQVTIAYGLVSSRLDFEMVTRNIGNRRAPVVAGAHPYWHDVQWAGDSPEIWVAGAGEEYETGGNPAAPTGRLLRTRKPLGEYRQLEEGEDFAVTSDGRAGIRWPLSRIAIEVEDLTDECTSKVTQVWRAPDKRGLCALEMLTGIAHALRLYNEGVSRTGLVILDPGESLTVATRWRFKVG